MRLHDLHVPSSFWVPLFCVVALGLAPGCICSQSNAVTLTPDLVVAGSPELLHVQAAPDSKLEGDWLGHKVQFFPAHDGRDWFALTGVDVEAPTGPSVLRVVVRSDKGALELSRTIEIHPAHYRTTSSGFKPRASSRQKFLQRAFQCRCGRGAFALPSTLSLLTASARAAPSTANWPAFTKGWIFARQQELRYARETAEWLCWHGRSTMKATAW